MELFWGLEQSAQDNRAVLKVSFARRTVQRSEGGKGFLKKELRGASRSAEALGLGSCGQGRAHRALVELDFNQRMDGNSGLMPLLLIWFLWFSVALILRVRATVLVVCYD